MEDRELIDGELQRVVLAHLPDVLERARAGEAFDLRIPEGEPLAGRIRFYQVQLIDPGFRVPESLLRTILCLNDVEEWRA